ncbi:MAG: cryptochrome/photolyase family protein [bacterium]
MRLIVWFRCDLRITDNVALFRATQDAEEVIPVYIFDDNILKRRGTGVAGVSFLLDSLGSLNRNLNRIGSRLIVRRGDPLGELIRLAGETESQGVYFNKDYEPYTVRRDGRVIRELRGIGLICESFKDSVMFEEREILSADGTPHTTYAQYRDEWLLKKKDRSTRPLRPKRILTPQNVPSIPLPTARDLGFAADQFTPKGGEKEAIRILNRFIADGRLGRYAELRDCPAIDGTSHLSPHLKFGTISIRMVYWACVGANERSDKKVQENIDAFIYELIRRDFHRQILFNFPHVERGCFRGEYDRLPWENDERFFQAWCEGKTGYPIVDAGMRQLNTEGWMHNRARMIVASFLTKDLLIDWRWGARYFMEKLVDGDMASNTGGWQWAASTGAESQPYFRTLNPVSQSERFDPAGEYIKRYVPELRGFDSGQIHAPWKVDLMAQKKAGCVIGLDYPTPIVDHRERIKRALAMFRNARESGDA